jgi:hypothetical protein
MKAEKCSQNNAKKCKDDTDCTKMYKDVRYTKIHYVTQENIHLNPENGIE